MVSVSCIIYTTLSMMFCLEYQNFKLSLLFSELQKSAVWFNYLLKINIIVAATGFIAMLLLTYSYCLAFFEDVQYVYLVILY